MKAHSRFHNPVVAAVLAVFLTGAPLLAQTDRLDELFAQLQTDDAQEAAAAEQEIWNEWSKSGSPAMDLLLDRGRRAMADGYPEVAIEHLTALVDHAPDFAEGWNARATAYYQTGDLGPAVSDIGHVLTLNPRHFGALSGLGAIFEELERPEQALEVYRAALAINPHGAGLQEAIDRLQARLQGQDL